MKLAVGANVGHIGNRNIPTGPVRMAEIDKKIQAFRDSVTPDLYLPSDFIDFDKVQAEVNRLKPGLSEILEHRKAKGFSKTSLGNALKSNPVVFEVLMLLASIRGGIYFPDGRYLPERSKTKSGIINTKEIAELLLEIGVDKLLKQPGEIESQLLIAVVADLAESRRFPTRTRFEARIESIIDEAIKASQRGGKAVKLLERKELPQYARRRAEYAISIDDEIAMGIGIVFQAQSGGRQQRDLRVTYPELASELRKDDIQFCLIADGLGLKEASDGTLAELLKGVPYCMTTNQAEGGALVTAISAYQRRVPQDQNNSASLNSIIASAIYDQSSLSTDDLPSSEQNAKLALASFANNHPNLGVELVDRGGSLRWQRPEEIRRAQVLANRFREKDAIKLLVDLIGTGSEETSFKSSCASLKPSSRSKLSFDVSVFAADKEFSTELASEISAKSYEIFPDNRVAVVILPNALSASELNLLQRHQLILTTSVVAIGVDEILEMARGKEMPSATLQTLILKQADLGKVSPFVLRGATPREMFYGRENEEADLLATLSSNSVAILGGRRIGKTSLLLHAQDQLTQAGFQTYFCDCQAVANWNDFGQLISRQWDVEVPKRFAPHNLLDLIKSLSNREAGSLILLLDEIDQLLKWDLQHEEGEAPEAFFRSCRSVSQQSLAQFVFSGERIIANQFWNAQSPHWNFCKPLMLTQLGENETAKLISEPLLRLGIEITDAHAFEESVWERTSGHPELVQFLGDALINQLNEGDRKEFKVGVVDVEECTNRVEYAEQYLETYWGQSTNLERLISILLCQKNKNLKDIENDLRKLGVKADQSELFVSLKMLELYGIVRRLGHEHEIRPDWFGPSLRYYGGIKRMIETYGTMCGK